MKKNNIMTGLAALITLAMVTPALSAEKNWPCIQRKVPTLSVGNYWQGPSIEGMTAQWRDDPEVATLVERIVSRRTSLEDATKLIAEFAVKAGTAKQDKLTLVFAGVFSELNSLRSTVMSGIDRYVKAQQSRADEIAKVREQIRQLFAKDGRTPAENEQLVKLQQQLNWQVRIYEDRENSRLYICEVPVFLEQRVYALAQDIQNSMS